jgi:FMN-dependent NADH-azoreductase
MKKILHVISSPRGAASFSIQLGNAIVQKLLVKYPGSTVKEVNLNGQHAPRHLEELHLASFFTPVDQRTEPLQEAVKYSDEAINDLKEADIIVIGAPMYNFTIHSSLKAWIDQIARAGVTFAYGPNGPEGLLKDKKVYVAISSGGIYTEGPRQQYDFITSYLQSVLGFLGLTDISFFRIEGVSIPEIRDAAVEKGLSSVNLN